MIDKIYEAYLNITESVSTFMSTDGEFDSGKVDTNKKTIWLDAEALTTTDVKNIKADLKKNKLHPLLKDIVSDIKSEYIKLKAVKTFERVKRDSQWNIIITYE